MRRLIEIATERRVTIVMLMVAIVLFGMVSLSRLKLNLLPDISYPTVTVRTELTGAAPVEVENLLTKPIEEAVGVVRNVRLVRSVSRSGQSDVTVEFLWGTDMDMAGVDIREKLDVLFMPLEASRPLLLRFDPSSEPIVRLGLLYKESADQNGETSEARLKALRRLAEDSIKTDLEDRRFNHHLFQHNVEAFDHIFQSRDIGRLTHQQNGVGALIGQDPGFLRQTA